MSKAIKQKSATACTLCYIFLVFFIQIRVSAQIVTTPIGKPIFEANIITDKVIFVLNKQLKRIDKSYSKSVYNLETTDFDNAALYDERRDVVISKNAQSNYDVAIPPLQPSRLYRLNITYVEGLFAVMLKLHTEGNGNWHNRELEWMKEYKRVSVANAPYLLTFTPRNIDVTRYKAALRALPAVNAANMAAIRALTLLHFPNMQFQPISDQLILDYAIAVNTAPAVDDALVALMEETVCSCYDYQGFYDFYVNRMQAYLSVYNPANPELFDIDAYRIAFNAAVAAEMATYGGQPYPNYLRSMQDINFRTVDRKFSTYAETFAASYQRILVPDFGYAALINANNDMNGGVPFIGVNLSLAASNKDIPFSLSKLSFWQRVSIHTGVTVNTVKSNGKRDDFFKDTSLMLGIGVKPFSHAARLITGVLIHKKIDPITTDKTIAFQPYIGLSIDLEIKKWLSDAGVIKK